MNRTALFGILTVLVPWPVAAQGPPPLEWPLGSDTTLKFSGHMNMGVLFYDGGSLTETYAPVDYANASNLA